MDNEQRNVVLVDEVQGSVWTSNGYAGVNDLDQAQRFTPAEGLRKAFELQASQGSPVEIHRYYEDRDESVKVTTTEHARAWPVTDRAFKTTLGVELDRGEYLDARDGAAARVAAAQTKDLNTPEVSAPEAARDNAIPAYGITQIDGKPATSLRFERMDKDGQQSYTVSFHMGNKQIAKFKNLDAAALAETVGGQNAKAISGSEQAKGSLKNEALQNEYGLSPEEIQRRAATQLDKDSLEPDGPDELNKIEHDPAHEQVNIEEALATAAKLRARDRQAWAASQGLDSQDIGMEAEATRIRVENLGEKAQELDSSNQLAERTGQTTDYDSQVDAEREKNRQAQLMETLHHQFRVSGPRYHFKDQPDRIAFKDKGSRMVSASNDERVAHAMATMADAKGWKTITVTGHPDFQREVWMEAKMRGIEVKGFKPTEKDLEALEARQDRQMKNSIERSPDDRSRRTEQIAEKEPAQGEQSRQAREARPAGLSAAPTLRTHAGRLIEHGEAHFNHDPAEKLNYFVKLAGSNGKEETVWGVDLKRAMADAKAQPGDNVQLDFKGKQRVTVVANERDDKNQIIGQKEIEVNRNTWDVKSDRAKVVSALADKVIEQKVKDPAQRQAFREAVDKRLQQLERSGNVPAVPMYDKDARTRTTDAEQARPQIERNTERTR